MRPVTLRGQRKAPLGSRTRIAAALTRRSVVQRFPTVRDRALTQNVQRFRHRGPSQAAAWVAPTRPGNETRGTLLHAFGVDSSGDRVMPEAGMTLTPRRKEFSDRVATLLPGGRVDVVASRFRRRRMRRARSPAGGSAAGPSSSLTKPAPVAPGGPTRLRQRPSSGCRRRRTRR